MRELWEGDVVAREGFQYFVERYLETGEARSLWRRKRFRWQYLSLIDWNWHRVWPWRVDGTP